MNCSMIFMECVVLCVLFTVIVVTISRKDPLAGVNNWPPAIQQRAQELGLTEEKQRSGSKAVLVKKLAAALVIALLFAIVVYCLNEARSFATGFGYSYFLWTVVNWYDALVIDCLWVCHDKRVRIPGTEDMEEYQDYLFHIKGSVKGQLIGLPVCALVGGLTALLTKIL